MLALTHAHPDHQGVAKDVCEARGIPLACHADDVEAMEGRRPMQEAAAEQPGQPGDPRDLAGPAATRSTGCSSEGDEVAGFRVVHAPGHARGEVIFFRESDRVAICGDVIRNMSYATALPGIKEPPAIFTYDPAENRRSIRKLAELEPVPDPPRPRPRRDRHRRLRALRRRAACIGATSAADVRRPGRGIPPQLVRVWRVT